MQVCFKVLSARLTAIEGLGNCSPSTLGSSTDGELAVAIQKACFNNKLLLERGGRGGNVVRVLCAVNINQAECEEFIKRFAQSIADALKAVRG